MSTISASTYRPIGPTNVDRVRWHDLCFLGLLGYVLVFPWGNNKVLIPLLGAATLLGSFRWLSLNRRIRAADPRTGLLVVASAGLLPLASGLLSGTPGATDVGIALIGGPVAWYLIAFLPGPASVRLIPLLITYTSLAIAIMVIATGLRFDVPILSTVYPRSGGAVIGGASRVHSPLVGTLLVTLPIALYNVARSSPTRSRSHRRADRAALMLGTLAVALSGRQALVVVAVAAPLFVVAIKRWLPNPSASWASMDQLTGRWFRNTVWACLTGVVLVIFASFAGIDLLSIPRNVLASLGQADADAERVARSFSTRSRQHASLLRGWRERPLFGHGFGAVVPDRHTWRQTSFLGFTPWRAELQYHLLLFEAGAIGMGLYALAMRSSAKRLKRSARLLSPAQIELTQSLLVGALGLLIATATNPYIRGIGRQWVLMLPLAVVGVVRMYDAHSTSALHTSGLPGASSP